MTLHLVSQHHQSLTCLSFIVFLWEKFAPSEKANPWNLPATDFVPGGWDKSQEARKNPCQVDSFQSSGHHPPQSTVPFVFWVPKFLTMSKVWVSWWAFFRLAFLLEKEGVFWIYGEEHVNGIWNLTFRWYPTVQLQNQDRQPNVSRRVSYEGKVSSLVVKDVGRLENQAKWWCEIAYL